MRRVGKSGAGARHEGSGHPDRPPRIRSQILVLFVHRAPDSVEPNPIDRRRASSPALYGRATYSLRCVDPEVVEGFAGRRDLDMMECLCSILRVDLMDWSGETRGIAMLPMSLGGLGGSQCPSHQQGSPWGKLG